MKPILILQFILYASLNSFTRDYCLLLRLHNASRRLLCLQTAKLILLRPRFSTVAPKLELLPCPNTNDEMSRSVHVAMLSEKPETPLTQSLYLADGAIATGINIVSPRYFQESSNRNLTQFSGELNPCILRYHFIEWASLCVSGSVLCYCILDLLLV